MQQENTASPLSRYMCREDGKQGVSADGDATEGLAVFWQREK